MFFLLASGEGEEDDSSLCIFVLGLGTLDALLSILRV